VTSSREFDETADSVPPPHAALASAAMTPFPGVVPSRVHPAALVAFVSAFLLPICAVPAAHLAIRLTRRQGRRGRGLARAALVIAYLNLAILTVVAVNIVISASLTSSLR
jgi:hypothetical protein